MDTVVRGLTEKDWPDALVLAERVFAVGPWLFHTLHQGSSDRRFADASGAWVDGELVSLVDVFFRQVRMPDGQTAKMGGIGTVCTHPNYRGQGLSGQLINRVDQVMIEQGADWSMLFTGVQSHYARYGWVEVPTYWLEKSIPSLPTSGANEFRIETKEYWKLGEPVILSDLFAEAAEGSPVSCLRDDLQWNWAVRERLNRPNCRTLLAWSGDVLAGYLVAKLSDEGIEIFEAGGEASVLQGLTWSALSWAQAEGKANVSLDLPSKVLDRLPAWITEGSEEKSGNWTMVKAISARWNQAELEGLFTSKQAHHFSLDNF